MKKVVSVFLIVLTALIICIPIYNKQKERNFIKESWKEDFDFIQAKIDKAHPFPYKRNSKEKFDQSFIDLLERTPDLTDDEVAYEIGKIISLIGDGHSKLHWDKYWYGGYYPLRFKIIDDEVYIVKAKEKYRELLFKPVISINEISIKEIESKLSNYISAENEYYKKAKLELFLNCEFYLNLVLPKNENDYIDISFIDDDKEQTISVKEITLNEFKDTEELYTNIENKSGTDNYYFQYFESSKILVFTYKNCSDDKEISMVEFNQLMWDFIESHEVDKLVIDISNNYGGSDYLFNSFLSSLQKSDYNNEDKSFVIIGNHNYSAATLAASMMKRLTNATLIGEPTGGPSRMTFNPILYTTPDKEVEFKLGSKVFEVYPGQDLDTIMPDVLIEKSVEDYKNNIEPCLEYVKMQ